MGGITITNLGLTFHILAFSKSIPIKKDFSLGLKDLIRLLTSIELFQPISFI